LSEATPDQKAATAGIFKNMINLFERGLWFGEYGGLVAEAIGFLKANVAAIEEQLGPKAVASPAPDAPPPAAG
jgi:hypothetical protein